MATVNYTINTSTGDDWSGSFTVTTTSNSITTELPTSIDGLFSPAQFETYGQSGVEYVTWRSVDISGESSGPPNYLNVYPTSGYSFDIWSQDLYNTINGGATWDNLNGQTYNLSATKNTLIYYYSGLSTLHHGSGGTISFTVV